MTQPPGAARESHNPLPEIWTSGRDAFLSACQKHPQGVWFALAALSGVADVFVRIEGVGRVPTWSSLAYWLLFIGPLWGVARLYLLSLLLLAAVRILRGHASFRDVREVLAWATLPAVGMLALWLLGLGLLGRDFFVLESAAGHGSSIAAAGLVVLGGSAFVAYVYGFWLLTSGLARIEGYRPARALLTIGVSVVLLVLLAMGVTLSLGLLR